MKLPLRSRRAMSRATTLLPVAFLLAISVARPAAALPDYAPTVPVGWSEPIVLRPTPDATAGGAVDPVALTGDGTSYVNAAFINGGTTAGTVNTILRLQLDGVLTVDGGVGTLPAGASGLAINVAITATGGLHTGSLTADATNVLTESNEANNSFARQFSFTPVNLPLGAQVSRAAPSLRLGGTSSVSGTVYPNQDGLRLPSNDQPWEAVALRPPVGQDYDLALYDATTGIGNGFRIPLKVSTYGNGVTDFILNNGNFVGAPPHDIGIENFSAGSLPYGIEHRQAGSQLALGGSYPGLSLASQQMLFIAQYQHLPDPAVPRVLFELTGAPGQVLHLALFNPSSMSIFARSDAMSDAVTDVTGRAILDMPLETTGQNKYYGVVVYRDQSDGGTLPTTFTLRLRQTPADLTNSQVSGFTVPVNASNAGGSIIVEPTALDGNLPNTTMTYYFQNGGTQTASGFSTEVRLDGAAFGVFPEPTVAAGDLYGTSLAPMVVRGGRHTLSYQTDVANAIEETSETNNSYGKQFVWSPLVMTPGVPVTRPMPPDPEGGWNDIPGTVPKYPNVDGLRINPPANTGVCIATALVPAAGTDVDLDWFTKSTGPANGFATPLATSLRGIGQTDLLVECWSGFSGGYDIGLRRFTGPDLSCTVQSVLGTTVGIDSPVIGPATLASGQVVQAFQFLRFTYQPMTVVLENLSGSADLNMSIYAFGTQGPQSFNGTLPGGLGAAGGAGSSEFAFVDENLLQQTIAIVVWKAGSADVAKDATFRLLIDPNVSGVRDAQPRETTFAAVGGNPIRSSARLRFNLPEPRDIDLDILDVQGRRVRALASGPHPAGPHALDWNGTDDDGRSVANGTYFARFATGGFRRVVKLSLLR